MKKYIKYLMFVIVLVFSLTAMGCTSCNFINPIGDPDNSEITNPDGSDASSYQKLAVDVDLKSSLNFAEGITHFGKSHDGAPYSSVAETIAQTKVNRACVAIFIAVGDGVVCGSGVIVDIEDGKNYGNKEDNIFYVITCHHVVDNCEETNYEMTISVPDATGKNFDDIGYDTAYNFKGKIGGAINTEQAVSLVGGDKKTDIALLRLYVSNDAIASNIVKAKMMSTEYAPMLGEQVFAIGNSEGSHGGWTASGTISDLSCVEEINTVGDMSLMGINVDIYQGNSGGGLFNLYGELIAIPNSGETISATDGKTASIGINYAIPHKTSEDASKDTGFINIIKQLLGSYINSGKNYGYVENRVDNYWISFSVSNGKLVVAEVINGSQAVGKVAVGDVIKSVKVNEDAEKTITSREQLKGIINGLSIGDNITFNFVRTSDYGQSVAFSRTFVAKQYYFCNTGDYTNIKTA